MISFTQKQMNKGVSLVDKYDQDTCPKPDTWFMEGNSCGFAPECEECSYNPHRNIIRISELHKLQPITTAATIKYV